MAKIIWKIRFLLRVMRHADARYYHHFGWHAYGKTPEQIADDLVLIGRQKDRDAVLCDILRRWMAFSGDVSCGCAAGDDELQMLRDRTERLLTPNPRLTGEFTSPR